MSEPLTRLLAELPPAEPDTERAERIRMRCRARLRRQALRAAASAAATRPDLSVQVWQPLITVLAVAYLTEVIVHALRVYGLP
jgi:hypothetical protein